MRAPDPMRECRPGGTCPECNAVFWCADCGDITVSDQGEVCAECSVQQGPEDGNDETPEYEVSA